MGINYSKSTSNTGQKFIQKLPQPGEIWEVNRLVNCPVKFSQAEQNQLYSHAAKQFLAGNYPPINVMIVTVDHPQIFPQEWQVISVMVLSEETQFLSDVDLLIPAKISGLKTDVLGLTW